MTDWNQRFLDLAKHISTWSKDPSRKIGAVIVNDDKQILSTGWNGFPRGIKDNTRLDNREEKYQLIVHAEMNAIYNATHNGISLKNSTLYVTGLPVCASCALGVIQVGIKRVIMPKSSNLIEDSIWKSSWIKSSEIFSEAKVEWLFE